MTYENILLERAEGIATLTLNRPEKMNAINMGMAAELEQALEETNSDDAVRVLIITGAGRGFCSGADLSLLGGSPDVVYRWLVDKSPAAGGIRSFTLQIQNFEKPTIAAVNGSAAGAGFCLALACDIRIASDKASFSQIFIRRGVIPDTGATYFLPRMMGLGRACEIAFTGEVLDAQQAKEDGLVNRVLPHEQLMPAVRDLAARIAAGAPVAMKLAKRALYRGAVSDLPAALEFEGYLQGVCFGTEDFKEGVAAFIEKREPEFKGK